MSLKEELLAGPKGPASNFRHIQLCVASSCRVPEAVRKATFFSLGLSYTQLGPGLPLALTLEILQFMAKGCSD